ncbi:helix-turn-helix domain-containing protein [Geoalkalibacter subterraneus]|uniref:helix-turn-helix domain-containing protein n=1 Tax=Geoalkalibacter subterraneus TaxID=483547 RepID=UPI001F191372|nr:helix-turn-helix domain-containing protein [Geoalkalibacter subterraneus]
MFKDPEEKNAWIKYQLGRQGSSFAKIAKKLGVSREAPRRALCRPYPRMEKAIAEEMGYSPEQIWPERYDEWGRHKNSR